MGPLLWIVLAIALLLLTATILWKTSHFAKLFLKFTIFAIASMVSATAPIPLMLLRPRDSRNALYVARFVKNVTFVRQITNFLLGSLQLDVERPVNSWG